MAWSAFQLQEVTFCVASGIRKFYFPSPPYDWTFLKPTAQIGLPANQNVVQLPDDFGGFEGKITIESVLTPTSAYAAIQLMPEARIRMLYQQQPTTTGPTCYASLQPIKGTTQVSGTRDQLYVWPIPDQSYQLQFQYYVLPDMLSGTNPYVYGGMSHSETILQACLSVAEFRKNNELGPQTMMFREGLQASMGADRRLKPQMFGRNKDTSDDRWYRRNPHESIPANTYNGNSLN